MTVSPLAIRTRTDCAYKTNAKLSQAYITQTRLTQLVNCVSLRTQFKQLRENLEENETQRNIGIDISLRILI